jgi:hypothetical protein
VSQRLRVLNDEGIRSFAEFIAEGALGDAPLHLLENPETSAPCSYGSIVMVKVIFLTGINSESTFEPCFRQLMPGRSAETVIFGHLWRFYGSIGYAHSKLMVQGNLRKNTITFLALIIGIIIGI